MQDLGSIHPLDAGFDTRALKMPVVLELCHGEAYRIKTADGTAEGSPEEVCKQLVGQGYSVVAANTPNGRNIIATTKGFEVQPHNDNYWLAVPTLEAALDAFAHPEKYR